MTFGDGYSQTLEALPDQLQSLTIGNYFSSQITSFPDTLTTFNFNTWSTSSPLPPFPPSLHNLRFHPQAEYTFPLILPESLKRLWLPIVHLDVALPAQLEELQCTYFSHIEMPLPGTLLKLKYLGDQPCPPVLPQSLQYLSFGVDYNSPLPALPPNLVSLKLGSNFKGQIASLPSTLRHIAIGQAHCNQLPHPLPPLLCIQYR